MARRRKVPTSATRHRRNPALLVLGNPSRGEVFGQVHEVRYAHRTRGARKHAFGAGGQLLAEPDGSIRIRHPAKALWTREGDTIWMENPNPKGRVMARTKRKARKSKRRPPRGFGSWKAYMASIRPAARPAPHRRNPMARRRGKRKGHRRRSRTRAVVRHGRTARRPRYRRNPGGGVGLRGIVGFLVQGATDGLAIVGGKVAARGIPQLIGFTPVGPLGIGVQTLAGTLVAWAASFVNRDVGRLMLGGTFASGYESVIRAFNVPFVAGTLGDETELLALAGYLPAAALPAGRGVTGMGSYVRGDGAASMAM